MLFYTTDVWHKPVSELDERLVWPVFWALNGWGITKPNYANDYKIGDDIFNGKNTISLVVRKEHVRTFVDGLPHDEDVEESGIKSKELFSKSTRQNYRQFLNLLNGKKDWFV